VHENLQSHDPQLGVCWTVFIHQIKGLLSEGFRARKRIIQRHHPASVSALIWFLHRNRFQLIYAWQLAVISSKAHFTDWTLMQRQQNITTSIQKCFKSAWHNCHKRNCAKFTYKRSSTVFCKAELCVCVYVTLVITG